MYALQDDLDRCTALVDEIDAGRKGDRRLAARAAGSTSRSR